MVDRADRALAKVLREGGLLLDRARNEAERAGRDLTIDQRERRTLELLVCQAVFAPMRGLRMMSTDPSQVAAEEAKVLAALAPAIDRYVFAIAEGRPPRVSPRARPDLRRVLETPVQIQL